MKVLHVTEELSKKNYSISSLIFFLSNFIVKKINFDYDVLTSAIQEEVFQKKSNIKIINYKKINQIFDNNQILSNVIKKYNVIHIHGIWRTINLLCIFFSISLNKNFYIHPHGMMLDAALKNKGILNYYLKILILKLFNSIYGKKLYFVSITELETVSIKKFFPKAKVFAIPNPVPIEEQISSNIEYKKRFVFFGRIHPIKNIHLIIQAFIKSNLSHDWNLEIYGIPDDFQYFEKLKKLASSNDNIFFKDPVFGKNKIEILKSSWCNILLSDSEVLSLSVLESASLKLPSLVNEEIQISEYAKNEGVITSLDVDMIANKINEISLWSKSLREKKGELLKNFIDNYYGAENISRKYLPLYKPTEKNRDCYKKNNIFEYFFKLIFDNQFFQISLSYIFNFTIPTLLMLFLTLREKNFLAADLAIVSSIFITISQIFSSNMKVQIISNNNINLAKSAYQFRFLFSLMIFLLFQYLLINNNFFEEENIFVLSCVVLLILIQWIGEIKLALKEIYSELSFFVIYNFLNITLCIFHTLIIFLSVELIVFSLIIHIILLSYFFIFQKNILFLSWNIKNIYVSFLDNIKTLAFLSSLSIIFSSLFWRIVIYSIFSKPVAAIYFACFAIGSFPGSTFNIAIGPTYIKQKITLSKNVKYFLYLFFGAAIIFCLISSIYIIENLGSLLPNKFFISYTLAYSILGAFFMTYAMYKRQYLLQKIKNKSLNIFFLDIIYGGSISILCPLLYYFGGPYLVSLTYFLASFLALIMYSSILFIIKDKDVPFIEEK